jgi:hypothetical protein
MRSRLLGLAIAAAAAATLGPAAHASYPHQCGGTVDRDCYVYDCSRNCIRIDCTVYVNLTNAAQANCVG